MPQTVTWRGVVLDPETAKYMDAVAAAVGDDILVTPIPGCGSYQRTTAASAGTHAGGGAIDINCEGLTDEQATRIETTARKFGGAAWFRPRLRPDGTAYGWQRHVHILRSDCADLASEAAAQVRDYRAGYDGLYYATSLAGLDRNKRRDTGNAAYRNTTWASVKTPPTPSIAPAQPAPVLTMEDTLSSTRIPGGNASLWHSIPVPNDGRKYRLTLSYGGGANPRNVELIVFGRVPSVTTASKYVRSYKWAWQRDVPGDITLNKGEGVISIKWDGGSDQTLAASLYPVGTL